jgi:hypothetical protein
MTPLGTKCPQRKIFISRMDTCPEGSIWQDPYFVKRDVQTSVIVTEIYLADH